MSKYYGIIGGGSCPKNIIEDGLRDIGTENAVFVVHGHKKPSSSEERVFDFLIENEADFYVVETEQAPAPKVLTDSAMGVYPSDYTDRTILEVIREKEGTLLVLWDEDSEERMNNIVLMAEDIGVVNIKELSNGLAPINVQATEDTEKNFSSKEIESMPPGVKKRNDIPVEPSIVEERPTLSAPDGDCMVTVVMPNGTVISTPATMAEVRTLLGLSGGS